MRTMVAPVLLTLAAAGAPVGEARPQPPPQASTAFPSSVDVVNVDVVVLDRQGNPVEGLTQADFTVQEDGRPQAISAFEAVDFRESPATAPPGRQRISTNATAPVRGDRSFVIVFDDANISSYASPRARKAITSFLDRGLRDGDQVMIAPTSGGPWWAGRMPEDHDTLVAFVDQLQGAWRPDTTAARIWDHEAIAIANGRNRQLEAEVARRYFENNLIPEAYPQDRELAAEINVSPGFRTEEHYAAFRETALASGAQYVSTDYMQPDSRFPAYSARLPNGATTVCNPVRAQKQCGGRAVK